MAQTRYKGKLPLVQTDDQVDFWHSFKPINRCLASDTYKRTMSGSVPLFADNFACYSLAARRALSEEGINGRWIMAGLEKVLYPWFLFPITKEEVDKAKEFCLNKANVKKFPEKAWQTVLDNNGVLPVDIWGFPGGQTFLAKDGKYAPMMSIEGIGALASHLEPSFTTIYSPLIQAVKARLMKIAAGDGFLEFGLRGDESPNNHVPLMGAVYVGGGIRLTSDDQACFLFQDYFRDRGTTGHELGMAYQKRGRTLEEAQRMANEDFVRENEVSAILPDIVHTRLSGLPMIMELIQRYPNKLIMPRFDSGDVPADNVYWKRMLLNKEIPDDRGNPRNKHLRVSEDGYNPTKVIETLTTYQDAGFQPDGEHIFGGGGYFREGCHRDKPSLVCKRTATEHDGVIEPSIKFATPGKGAVPGQIRVYGKDRDMIVAQAYESIDANALYVPLHLGISGEGLVYNESWHTQSQRADETWDAYDRVIYSPETQRIIDERQTELDEIRKRLQEASA